MVTFLLSDLKVTIKESGSLISWIWAHRVSVLPPTAWEVTATRYMLKKDKTQRNADLRVHCINHTITKKWFYSITLVLHETRVVLGE